MLRHFFLNVPRQFALISFFDIGKRLIKWKDRWETVYLHRRENLPSIVQMGFEASAACSTQEEGQPCDRWLKKQTIHLLQTGDKFLRTAGIVSPYGFCNTDHLFHK